MDGQLLWFKQDKEKYLNKDLNIILILRINMDKLLKIYLNNRIQKFQMNGRLIILKLIKINNHNKKYNKQNMIPIIIILYTNLIQIR